MSITKQLESFLGYVAEAALELFSPNHDSYPNIGIQPFDGDTFKNKH